VTLIYIIPDVTIMMNNNNFFRLPVFRQVLITRLTDGKGSLFSDNSRMFISSTFHSQGSTLSPLHPWFITGFADAESSFIILVNKNSNYKMGYSLQACFSICIHKKDRALLERIASFYGVGNITKAGKDSIQYRVSSTKDLKVIIEHFYKYPLITQKRADCPSGTGPLRD
jgi:hypothetical protein